MSSSSLTCNPPKKTGEPFSLCGQTQMSWPRSTVRTLSSLDKTVLTPLPAELVENFLGGLKEANLIPKRFLLQTGAKNYGFHIGPATSPSFEFDPRVTLEDNFYYPQEDLLSKFCEDTEAQWNVVSLLPGPVPGQLPNFNDFCRSAHPTSSEPSATTSSITW